MAKFERGLIIYHGLDVQPPTARFEELKKLLVNLNKSMKIQFKKNMTNKSLQRRSNETVVIISTF
jgi:hypothetical protein